jgi:dipeptidyl-peptidase-4
MLCSTPRSPRHPLAPAPALALALTSATLVGVADAQQQAPVPSGLTLEAIFSGETLVPREPEGLVWAPDGRSLLYRMQDGGRTGLFRFEVASGTTTRLADWDGVLEALKQQRPGYVEPLLDDVNRTGRFRFDPVPSPDGRQLVGTVAGDLFAFDLETRGARFLTSGPAPESFFSFSPDGGRLAFVREADLYLLDLASGAETRLTDRAGNEAVLNGVSDWVYEEELGLRRSYWWSPDGTRIAYLRFDVSAIPPFPITDELEPIAGLELQRYPQAGSANSTVRLGVLDLRSGRTTWIDTGAETDVYLARAGWWPDGRGVWYQWLDRAQTRLELRLADPATGASRTLVVEQDPAWVNVRDDLAFVDAERFVWSSERDGWRHLYLYRRGGQLERRLTQGRWQVEAVYGFDAARRVYFQATEKDPRERHLYRVGLDGSGLVRLTTADGTHAGALAPSGTHLIDTWSSLTQPTRVELLDADGRRQALLSDGVIPALADKPLLPVELGALKSADGQTLHTALIRPPVLDPTRKHPVLVYVYGGPHAQTVTNTWDDRRRLFFQYLAERGLAVFWLDNRGSWGRGHAFEAAVHRRLGTIELEDQLAGVAWLKAQPWVDPQRIGVYGGSYGGFMALTCLLKAPEVFRAGVAYAPVTDWRFYDTIYTERYMQTPAANPDGYRESAPLGAAERLAGKLFLIHGTMDNNVHLQNSLALVDRLARADKLFAFLAYPRVRHGIRTSAVKRHFHQAKADFLLRELVGPAP